MDDEFTLVDREEHADNTNSWGGIEMSNVDDSTPSTNDPSGTHCHRPRVVSNRTARNQLIAVSIVCTLFMIAEIIGGLLSHSLALITDATHMASDLASFLVSLFALWLARKPATAKMTFGFHRAEILGAMLSILLIWIVTAVLVFFAIKRIMHPDYDINANEMLITASLGVIFNIIMAIVLHSGSCARCKIPHSHFGGSHTHSHGSHNEHEHCEHSPTDHHHHHGCTTTHNASNSNPNLDTVPTEQPNLDTTITTSPEECEDTVPKAKNINIRAAFIHVIGDLIQSCGVFIAAVIIKVNSDYKIADPICTFIFSILVLFTTITVLKDIVLIIMEATPKGVDFMGIYADLKKIPGVKTTHSLHVWALTMDKYAASVHIAIDNVTDLNYVVKSARKILYDKHQMFHSTIQVESYEEIMTTCDQCTGPLIQPMLA